MRSWSVAVSGLTLVGLCAALMVGQPAHGEADAPRSGKPRKPAGAAAELACRTDADCVLVTDGCCGCREGGKQRAIPARAREAYERKRKALCRDSVCPALMSEDPSCIAGQAVCKEGACALGS